MRRARQALLLIAAFAAGMLLGELLGADNTGIAMTYGQLAFAAVLIAILLRG